MKTQEEWSQKADILLEEIRACRSYREMEDEMNPRMEQIYREYIGLLKESMKLLPVRGKLKMGRKILEATWDNRAFKFRWLMLKAGRLLMGLDI